MQISVERSNAPDTISYCISECFGRFRVFVPRPSTTKMFARSRGDRLPLREREVQVQQREHERHEDRGAAPGSPDGRVLEQQVPRRRPAAMQGGKGRKFAFGSGPLAK